MISARWLDQRTPHWRRLETLVDRAAAGGLKALARDELQELGTLYRQIAADLATVREDPGSLRFAASLNQLLARAHHTIYAAERPTGSAVWRFARVTFPAALRAHAGHIGLAFLIFLVGAVAGVALTYGHPDFTVKVLGPKMVETIAKREMWTDSIVSVKPLASSGIMTNNISVSFMAFASGITGGVGTFYMMLLNGVLIGVIGTACAEAGMSLKLWSFVAPHGVLELPAIFIAGGAGLKLAQGLLFPGLLPRRDAVARAGASAVTLIIGCVPILVIAGVIEGFVSPTALPVTLKFLFAAGLFTLLVWYVLPTTDSAA